MKNVVSKRHNSSKTHRLGQHQLIDNHLLSRIVREADVASNETVCEVGAGNGVLTEALCSIAQRVISFEVDAAKFREACQVMGDRYPNLTLINLDAFKVPPTGFDVLVSNLPYSRSRDAIEWLAQAKQCTRAIVMLQAEFAEKIFAEHGSESYRSVSAIARYCFSMERLFYVPKTAFRPQPAVRSVVLRLTRVNTLSKEMIAAVNLLFSFRNRQVSSVSRRLGIPLSDTEPNDRRVFQMAPEEVIMLASRIPSK